METYGFKLGPSAADAVKQLKKALANWELTCRPTWKEVAERLNALGITTPRGHQWNPTGLHNTLIRYNARLEDIVQWTKPNYDDPQFQPVSVKLTNGGYDGNDEKVVRQLLLAWADSWTLKFVPPIKQVVDQLNIAGMFTPCGRAWTTYRLKGWMQRLDFHTVVSLLAQTDWAPGRGRMTEAEKDALRRKLRGEDDEPEEEDKYERMRREGYEAHAAILRQQTCLDDEDAEWLAQYDGVSVEGVILRSYDLNPSPEGAELQSYDLNNLTAPVDEEGYPAA